MGLTGKIVIAFVILSLIGNYYYSSIFSSELSTVQSQKDQQSQRTEKKVYKFGERFSVGNMAYILHNTTWTKKIGSGILGEEADGIFIVLDVTIENVGKESTQLWDTSIKVVDAQGRMFDHDAQAELYLRKNAFVFEQLQPGLPKRGLILFDIPPKFTGMFEVTSDDILSNKRAWAAPFSVDEASVT